MCGGTCSTPRAPSLGGALAVLRPPPQNTTIHQRTAHRPQHQHGSKKYSPSPDSKTHTLGPPSPPPSPYHEELDVDEDVSDDVELQQELGREQEGALCAYFSGSMVFHHVADSTHSSIDTSNGESPVENSHILGASNLATHMTFTHSPAASPSSPPPHNSTEAAKPQSPYAGEYTVRIHQTGNLLEPAHTSSVLHSLTLRFSIPFSGSTLPQQQFPLHEPLEIGIGGQGIIGRRVTIWQHRRRHGPLSHDGMTTPQAEDLTMVAEGVLGFN